MPSNPKTILIVYPGKKVLDRFRRCISAIDCRETIQCMEQIPQNGIDPRSFRLVMVFEESLMAGGSTFFDYLAQHPPATAVILISNRGSVTRAVQSVRMGVKDYLLVDAPAELVQASVENALRLTEKTIASKSDHSNNNGNRPMVATAKIMQGLIATVDRIADAPATVLLRGESGTGKELMARYIHHRSHRRQRPFVAMNCGALPEHLAESELFGYEKGAFTGATHKRAGKFEQAHLSTLLLDEISEMPMALQVKLLRVLQEKEVDHIGGKAPIPVDTRIIATTNRNLAKMVQEGKFREDLYYRLRVVPLAIPPLRERREDIPLLAEHFISKHCPSHLAQPPIMSAETIQVLTHWPWPGNVRELENTIERAVLISDGITIDPESLLLDDELASMASGSAQPMVGTTVREMERKLIGETLDHVNQNRTHAAKMLGISIRTLRNKLKEYQTDHSDDAQAAISNPAPQ